MESDEEYPEPEPDLLEPPVSRSNRSNWLTFSFKNPSTSVTSSHSHAISSLEFDCLMAGVICDGCFGFKFAFWLLVVVIPWSFIAARSLFRLNESERFGGCGLRISVSLPSSFALLFTSLLSTLLKLLNSASLASFRSCLLSASFFWSVRSYFLFKLCKYRTISFSLFNSALSWFCVILNLSFWYSSSFIFRCMFWFSVLSKIIIFSRFAFSAFNSLIAMCKCDPCSTGEGVRLSLVMSTARVAPVKRTQKQDNHMHQH